MFIVQYVPWSVKSDIENNIKFSGENLSAILIWPFIADVEASIDCKNSSMSSPSSVVWLIADTVDAFCVELFNLISPEPGSAPTFVLVSNV